MDYRTISKKNTDKLIHIVESINLNKTISNREKLKHLYNILRLLGMRYKNKNFKLVYLSMQKYSFMSYFYNKYISFIVKDLSNVKNMNLLEHVFKNDNVDQGIIELILKNNKNINIKELLTKEMTKIKIEQTLKEF